MSGTGTPQRTPLYAEHLRAGAKMVDFAGFEMPIQYPTGIVGEHRAVRTNAGLFDLSHMGEFFFSGAAASSALDQLVSSDIAGLGAGQARYGLLCNERGTIVDDVIVYRLAADEYMMVVNAANIAKDRAHVLAHLAPGTDLDDRSAETALIAIQGPRAATLLASVTDLETREATIEDLVPFGVTRARVANSRAVVARTGYTGEDGFEVFVDGDRAAQVWSRLLAAGSSTGLVPIGLGARDTLRLEARFSLYGNDIDETTGPIEAGLGWTCKLDKAFVGRDPIVAAKEHGPSRRIAGLVIEGPVARHGHEVMKDGAAVGLVTSGTFGPTVQKNIALAYVPVDLAKIGTELAVRIRDRDIPARVVKTPFYRRAA
ncbi:MAG TPA: glycine cleavage system aminomethyltransferase GcvT [Candidatus Limnocylindria bacterium]|nr:glycine cleavage system aminomethyltransferase GcvT [Candidatus Limnocylindria bacterium]